MNYEDVDRHYIAFNATLASVGLLSVDCMTVVIATSVRR